MYILEFFYCFESYSDINIRTMILNLQKRMDIIMEEVSVCNHFLVARLWLFSNLLYRVSHMNSQMPRFYFRPNTWVQKCEPSWQVKVIVRSFVVLIEANGLEKSSYDKVCSAYGDWPNVLFAVLPYRIRACILSY